MSQKLTQEELNQLQAHRFEANRLAANLGELSYQKTLLEFELDNVKAGIKENVRNQRDFLKSLGEKYGDGSINFETGEIAPLEVAEEAPVAAE